MFLSATLRLCSLSSAQCPPTRLMLQPGAFSSTVSGVASVVGLPGPSGIVTASAARSGFLRGLFHPPSGVGQVGP